MNFRSTQILRRSLRQRMLISSGSNQSFYPLMISLRPFTTDKNASKSNTTDDPKDAAGFNIFEQLKAKQSGQSSAGFEEAPEMDEREKEKLKREAEKAQKDVNDRQKKTFVTSALVLGLASLGAYLYLGLESDDESFKKIPDESAFQAHNRRVWDALMGYYDYWTSPVVKKILPELLPAPYQRPQTVCVELNDSLIHLVWNKSEGWKAALRPGMKNFLAHLSRYYEVIIFTKEAGYLAEPVIAAIDPFQYAMYRLYKDHTHIVNGKFVKDIEHLNRDVGTVIMLDINPDSYSLQPENGIRLKPWRGEADDTELIRMGEFLEEFNLFVSMVNAKDVRPLLNSLRNIDPDDVPAAWQKYKEKMRVDFDTIQKEKQASTPVLGSLFRGRSQGRKRNVIELLESVVRDERINFAKEQEQSKAQMLEIQQQHEEAIKKQLEENKSKNLKLWDYMMGAGQPTNQSEPADKSGSSRSWFQELFDPTPQPPQDQSSVSGEASE